MFDEKKATQVAAYLLWKRGGEMAYLKLMKMMYLAEKKYLLKYGDSLMGDQMVSMPRGPVLSSVCDLFKGNRNKYWDSWIKNPGNNNLALVDSVKVKKCNPLDTFDELSTAEKKILDYVFDKCGNKNRWNLVGRLHNQKICPEWENPYGSSYPITRRSLLMKNGKSEQETEAILRSLEESEELSLIVQRLV